MPIEAEDPCTGCGHDMAVEQSSYVIGDGRYCYSCAVERGWEDADDGASTHEDCHNCGFAGNPPEAQECINCEAMLMDGQDFCENCHEPLVGGEGRYCSDCER